MEIMVVSSIVKFRSRRDALTGNKITPKKEVHWQINGQGDRRLNPWATCFNEAHREAIRDACRKATTNGTSTLVRLITLQGDSEIVVDPVYAIAAAESAARIKLAVEIAEREMTTEGERRWEKELDARAAALPIAQALGLTGKGGDYETSTDDTHVWIYVAGDGMDSGVQHAHFLAAYRSILHHAWQKNWAKITVNGRVKDVAVELAGDGWCRKWVLKINNEA